MNEEQGGGGVGSGGWGDEISESGSVFRKSFLNYSAALFDSNQ